MICAARLEQFGAPPKQRFCCLRGKATRAGETDVSLQGNAASSPGREGDSQNRAVSAGYCMLAFQHWKRDAAPLGSKASVCSFACRTKAVMAHCPWLCAFERCAAAAYGPGICTFCAHKGSAQPGESQQGYRPVRLHGGMQGIARWRAAAAVGCGFGLFIPVVAQMPFRRGGRLLWKAACGSLDPCWPRQAAP